MAATTVEVPRIYGRGTSSVVSIVVAMNRVDVVDLVVDLDDVDLVLDVDPVDVDLEVDLVLALPAVFLVFGSRLFRWYFCPAVFGTSLYTQLKNAAPFKAVARLGFMEGCNRSSEASKMIRF